LQFVRHRGNQDDTRFLPEVTLDLGVDNYHIVDVLLPFGKGHNKELIDNWITPDRLDDKALPFDIRESELSSPCAHLWQYPVINHDLTISPCCFIYSYHDDMADLRYQTFGEAWNSTKFNQARRLFTQSNQITKLPCRRCSVYTTFLKNK
jgi:radical SAM protein with 4Fe4S-binding SPASM domain